MEADTGKKVVESLSDASLDRSPVNGSPCKKKRASITGSKCHSEYLFRSNVSKMFLTALSNTASVGLERLFVFRGQCSFILKMNTD